MDPYVKGETNNKYVKIDHERKSVVRCYRVEQPDKIRAESNAKMFHEEVKVLSSVQHPNLIKMIRQEINVNGWSTVHLEYVSKISLDTVIHEPVWMYTVHTIHSTCKQLLAAIGALHRNGFIHRDIKPANILVAENWHLILADMETSKSYTDTTQTQSISLGTVLYKPPESFGCDAKFGMRGDIYSFGVTIGELITRQKCYSDISEQEILDRADHRKLKFPTIECRLDFAEIVAMCTFHTREFRLPLQEIEKRLETICDHGEFERVPNFDANRKEIFLPRGMGMKFEKLTEESPSLSTSFVSMNGTINSESSETPIGCQQIDNKDSQEVSQNRKETGDLKAKVVVLTDDHELSTHQFTEKLARRDAAYDALLRLVIEKKDLSMKLDQKENTINDLRSNMIVLRARLAASYQSMAYLQEETRKWQEKVNEQENWINELEVSRNKETTFLGPSNDLSQAELDDQSTSTLDQVPILSNLEPGSIGRETTPLLFNTQTFLFPEFGDPTILAFLKTIVLIVLIVFMLGFSRGFLTMLFEKLLIPDILISGVICYFSLPMVRNLVLGIQFNNPNQMN